MTRRYLAAFTALGLLIVVVAVMAVGFHGTTGCRGNAWWSTERNDFVQPYTVLAILAFAGASYFLTIAATTRRIAGFVAIGALLVGGPVIWFIALIQALTECPP